MVFLTELMNTRYICNALSLRLRETLEKLPEGETVNVNRVKFGPGAYVTLVGFMGKLNFVNSGDEKLNKILQDKQAEVRNYRKPNMPIPVIKSFEDILSFVNSVPNNLPYLKWEFDTSRDVSVAIIALILARPDLTIDISNRYVEIFEMLRSLGCPKPKHPIYVSIINRNYIQPKVPNGNYTYAPVEFGMGPAIDLVHPDPNHMFYKVVCNIRKLYEEPEYESFVDAVNKLM